MSVSKDVLVKKTLKKYAFILSFLAIPLISTAIFYFYVNIDSILMAFDVPNGEGLFYNFSYIIKEFAYNASELSESLVNTLYFFGANLLIMFPLSFIFSYFIFKKIKLYKFFRIAFYLPVIISGTVYVSLFKKMIAINGPLLTILNNLFNMNWYPEFLAKRPRRRWKRPSRISMRSSQKKKRN